jgi:AcrR family transcriptional regulator
MITFAAIMEEKILETSADLFLTYGFKSITMDDIANKIGISKKTIYQHYSNKHELIEAATLHLFGQISNGINLICNLHNNPIEEIYQIKEFVMTHLKGEKSSPQYQLQKYYPKIYKNLKNKQFDLMQGCVIENLKQGIQLGYYRSDIDVQFISRLYFSNMVALKDHDLYPVELFSMQNIMNQFLEYHLRGICTLKGIDILNNILSTESQSND